MKATKKKKEEAKRLYLMAIERFKQALESNPDNKNSLRNLADCYMHIGSYSYCRNIQSKYIDYNSLAAEYYLRAIKSDPNDTNSLFKYACFLDKLGELDKAEEYYLASLEADPYHRNCLCVYADFLAYCRLDFDTGTTFDLISFDNSSSGRIVQMCIKGGKKRS
jgi:tetratricopeptide (TPR) repeat protein